jgi:ABC-2 type transport system ATP-binding protein
MKAVEVERLTKIYSDFKAVDAISFDVDEGEIFGLLGPNGAGKTTTIRVALTLIRPTSGGVRVFGIDCVESPASVRQISGYVPQDVSLDIDLTGYENLLMYAKLYYIPRDERTKRIRDALESMELTDRQNDLAKTYSGGMMRRLEIAQALVNRPKVLFLDEPTIGLDPSAKIAVWKYTRRLREEFGTTILLTTHDMHEADSLCDEIAIMDKGKIVAEGSPGQLKGRLGGDVISLVAHNADCSQVLEKHGKLLSSKPELGVYEVVVTEGEKAIPVILNSLRKNRIHVESVSLKKPTLDDVFLKYAGARIDESSTGRESRHLRRAVRKRG